MSDKSASWKFSKGQMGVVATVAAGATAAAGPLAGAGAALGTAGGMVLHNTISEQPAGKSKDDKEG